MPTLEERIAGLKSAKVITDPAEIHKALSVEGRTAPGKSMDGSTRVEKRAAVEEVLPGAKVAENSPPVPTGDKLRALIVSRGLEIPDDPDGHVVPYYASDESVDSDGDIIRQAGIKFDRFDTNPVLPYGHRWGDPPIGAAIDWRVVSRSRAGYDGPALWLLGLFAGEKGGEFAASTLRLIRSGILRGGSIGFMPKRVISVQDETERAELGLGTWGVIFDEIELLEFSPTTIGANAGALSLLRAAQEAEQIEPQDVDVWREIRRRELSEGDVTEWQKADKEIRAAAGNVFAAAQGKSRTWRKHIDPTLPIVTAKEADAPEPEAEPAPEANPEPAAEQSTEGQLRALREEVDALKRELTTTNDYLRRLVYQQTDVRELIEDLCAHLKVPADQPAAPAGDTGNHVKVLDDDVAEDSVNQLTKALAGLQKDD